MLERERACLALLGKHRLVIQDNESPAYVCRLALLLVGSCRKDVPGLDRWSQNGRRPSWNSQSQRAVATVSDGRGTAWLSPAKVRANTQPAAPGAAERLL